MGKKFFPEVNRFPVLIQEEGMKTCYLLGKDGFLRQFQAEGNNWNIISPNLGQKTFKGFDALVDNKGKHLLITFNEEGALFLLQPGLDKGLPEEFYQSSDREIIHLSACLDRHNILHLLHLSVNKEKKGSSLTYHRYEDEQWREAVPLNCGLSNLDRFAFILNGPDDSQFILYCLYDNRTYRPILRELKKESALGKTISFPENWDNPLLPSICFTGGNTLHISLISRQNGANFLNYASLADNKWINSFSQEVSPFTLPLAPLYSRGNQLLLAWKNHYNMLCRLFSRNAGKDWQWAGSSPLGQYPRLFRFRADSNKQHQNTKWQAEYLLAYGIPPVHLIEPEESFNYKEEAGLFAKEFQNLDYLYSSLAAHAGQIQNANINLQNKLTKKEQEYFQLYARSISQTQEFQKAESTFKSTIKELQNLVQQEKKIQEEKQKKQALEISRLKEEIKNLQVEIISREETIRQLKEKNILIKQESEELTKKRGRFWKNLFK